MSILVRFTARARRDSREVRRHAAAQSKRQRASGHRTGSSTASRSAPVATSESVRSGTQGSSSRHSARP